MADRERIGVFICRCGTNIAGTVDVSALKEHFSRRGHFASDHLYLCSKSGQEAIKAAIREHGLERVVIASCSPKHHGNIFKECVGKELNPYMWDMANIREQCAWTTEGRAEATRKAQAIIAGSVARVSHHSPIGSTDVPVLQRVAVIGGGVAGLHASLELAAKGFQVHLIEKEPGLGGNAVRLDRTFPTDDCAMCTISPILHQVMAEPLISVITMSEVKEVRGRPGEYHLKLVQRPRFVDPEKCTACGACAKSQVPLDRSLNVKEGLVDRLRVDADKCNACGACADECHYGALVQSEKGARPTYHTSRCVGCWECLEACKFDALEIINVCPVVAPSEFDMGLGFRKAIYIPGPQSVPTKYLRDEARCLALTGKMRCQGCTRVCDPGAIQDDDAQRAIQLDVGAIVVATGYQQVDLQATEYRAEHPDVITGLELERLLSPTGPTQGRLLRPSDAKRPVSIAFVQCAGSRDRRRKEYCSKICCMYATKNAMLAKRELPDADIKVLFTDMRAAGRGYEEYFDRAREMGVDYVRGNVGEVVPLGDQLLVKVENTLLGEMEDLLVDLVVLSTALEPSPGTKDLERIIPLTPAP